VYINYFSDVCVHLLVLLLHIMFSGFEDARVGKYDISNLMRLTYFNHSKHSD